MHINEVLRYQVPFQRATKGPSFVHLALACVFLTTG